MLHCHVSTVAQNKLALERNFCIFMMESQVAFRDTLALFGRQGQRRLLVSELNSYHNLLLKLKMLSQQGRPWCSWYGHGQSVHKNFPKVMNKILVVIIVIIIDNNIDPDSHCRLMFMLGRAGMVAICNHNLQSLYK